MNMNALSASSLEKDVFCFKIFKAGEMCRQCARNQGNLLDVPEFRITNRLVSVVSTCQHIAERCYEAELCLVD